MYEKNQCLENCAVFIDGTVVCIIRPSSHNLSQRVLYNGHKLVHAIKYQALMTPDGSSVYLPGPKVGRRLDMFLYVESGLDDVLVQVMVV